MTVADLVSANRANLRWQLRRPRMWKRLAIVFPVLVGLAAIALRLIDGSWEAAAFAAPLCGVIALAGVFAIIGAGYLLMPRRLRRLAAQQRTFHDEVRVRWDGSRLNMESASWSSALAWQDYYRWGETEAEFLLFLNERMPHFLPRRVLTADQAADLRATLVEHGPPRG